MLVYAALEGRAATGGSVGADVQSSSAAGGAEDAGLPQNAAGSTSQGS